MAEAAKPIKDAFREWVESWGWETPDRFIYPYNEIIRVQLGDKEEEWPLPHLLGRLWRSTDVMPTKLCDRLNLPEGSTYAKAAQGILASGRRGKFNIPRTGYRVPPD